ncbi:putative cytosolic iron-sulfur protein assembly protein 1 [Podospora australis]|uniref:Cytosolic iron-sulfur protein assembly protein 1 n=1 Tax=Podospora australis TaxID=1536484 RepID=A0AAN6X619_9PEZI|nr:putative cytosolic iron-sulfur protein assembly protein 1 [Podospora australis]
MESKIQNSLHTKIRHNFGLSPITALEFYHDESDRAFLLAGEDTWLKVFDVANSRLLGQLRIFNSQPIHGLHMSKSTEKSTESTPAIILWGGQVVTVLPLSSLRALMEGSVPPQPKESIAPDWIYDGILFSSKDENSTGALVTAHNEILPLAVSADGQSLRFGFLTSPSRPILYSAHLCWLGSGTILVAGGTVFGEIIVWKYYLDASRSSQWEVLFVFTGHEGSIFGVTISPEIKIAPDTTIRLLASCSDDRTIRIWDITDRPLSTSNGEGLDSKALGEARETGFGGNSEAKEENKNDSSRCVAVAMGHLSRIWHVKFGQLNPSKSGSWEIYSFGEDTTRQRWELDLDLEKLHNGAATRPEGTIGTLRNSSADSCHSGKNIWSVAVSNKAQPSLVATGGADSRIVLSGGKGNKTNQPGGTRDYESLNLSFSYDDMLQRLQSQTESTEPRTKGAKHTFQKYAFLSDRTVIATTTPGRLVMATVDGDDLWWEEADIPEAVMADLRSYNIMKSPAQNAVVLGSATGKIYLYQKGNGIRELAQFSGKISDLLLVRDPTQRSPEGQPWSIIVTVLGQDRAHLIHFDPSTDHSTIDSRQIILPEHYIITATAFCGSTLILGSRIGALTVYNLSHDSSCYEPGESRRDSKAKDAITGIVPLPGSGTSVLATCRDGKYRIYTLSSPSSLTLQHEISPPIGMIEGAWFSPSNGSHQLLLHGFRGKHFVVWNETTRTVLASIECGGAHRPFACISPLSDPNQLRLVFTKASIMRFYSQPTPFLRTLKEGGHGRELRAVASCGKYTATAAEDTTIRIWSTSYSSPNCNPLSPQKMKCLAILEKHSAGIQSLKWHGEKYLLSSAGSEELYIWKVQQLDSEYDALAVVCEAVWDDGTEDGDLRIMDFDVSSSSEEDMQITIILSNSEVRKYHYSQAKFTLLSSGRYTGACPTQVRHLFGGSDILTAYTDGHLAIWRPSSSDQTVLEIVTLIKLHQSSIKCLDLTQSSPSNQHQWLIATGGDDNALSFLDLSYSAETQEYSVKGRYRVRDAHGAAVTGLCAVSHSEEEGGGVFAMEVATVSNDQRVKLWRATRRSEDGKVDIKLLDNKYSAVADAGDLELVAAGKLMVGGVGVEVWDVAAAE